MVGSERSPAVADQVFEVCDGFTWFSSFAAHVCESSTSDERVEVVWASSTCPSAHKILEYGYGSGRVTCQVAQLRKVGLGFERVGVMRALDSEDSIEQALILMECLMSVSGLLLCCREIIASGEGRRMVSAKELDTVFQERTAILDCAGGVAIFSLPATEVVQTSEDVSKINAVHSDQVW
jgi:hypothetical protein